MTQTDQTIEPIPRRVRPTTLHNIVIGLWVAVGLFAGAGIAAIVGTIHAVRDQDLRVTEHVALIGTRAGPLFVVAIVALGAIAIVEAILITLGHVQHVEHELER